MAVAKHYGVLPDDVESRMSEYWFNRTLVFMEAEAIEEERRHKEMNRK